MKIPEPVKKALDHVRNFNPEVTQVNYHANGIWVFMDNDLKAPIFDDRIDVGILDDAADFVSDNYDLPIIFEIDVDKTTKS